MDHTSGLHARFIRQVFYSRPFLASVGDLEEVEQYRPRI